MHDNNEKCGANKLNEEKPQDVHVVVRDLPSLPSFSNYNNS